MTHTERYGASELSITVLTTSSSIEWNHELSQESPQLLFGDAVPSVKQIASDGSSASDTLCTCRQARAL